MFTQTDYDKLRQIMEESPEKKELLNKLLTHHQMEISSLSHEIRNPLTLVYSELQLIESQHPEVHDFSHWNSLHQDIEYINRLLAELSSYNNSVRLSLEPLHTESFLKSSVLSFAASLADTDIEFTSRIELDLPDILADSAKLRQLLLNLLRNAKDAVDSADYPGAGRRTISLHAFRRKEYLSIAVSDNGDGIPPEQLSTIFEPFITYKKEGTGLGLAIARRIASAHGGSLSVSNNNSSASDASGLTRGVTFLLSLPI